MSQTTTQGWRIDLTDEEVMFIRRGLTKECLSWTKGESGIPKILEKLHNDFLAIQDNKVEEIKKSTLDPMRLTIQGKCQS